MSRLLYTLRILLPALLLAACARGPQLSPQPADVALAKHPLDQSEYRHFIMDNGLKVLLVSDPRFNKSAAAMYVGVGTLSNPKERMGLAHFLEHMLFMGTEKYPDVDEYLQYINENGGSRNAYTTEDHTAYFFEINHPAFEGALDRLSQFFIAPLFSTPWPERELQAVHSEHQKNLENDSRRRSQVQRTFYREDHPAHTFATGSLETLQDTGHEELLDFYQDQYDANRMALALLGKTSLDSLEQWARLYFAPVADKGLPRVTFDPVYLPEKATFRLISLEPIKELRSLELEFPLPVGLRAHYQSKPTNLLSSLIGHEGKGSLLALLKQKDLATGLSAGGYDITDDYGAFSVNVDLTPQGLENYRDVVRLCLSYVALLTQERYPSHYFGELKTKASLDEVYSNRGEGAGYARRLANQAADYPLEIAARVSYLYGHEDPEVYRQILSYLRPDNMMVTLMAQGVSTTDTEPYYGTPYDYTEDDSFYQELLHEAIDPALHLPEPNPFIPRQAAIPDRLPTQDVVPTKILDEEGLALYHAEDFEFLRPKVTLHYKLRFPAELMSLRRKVLLDTYTASVNESLNELAYPAQIAGLSYSFASGYEGVYFSVSGFDESAPRLFDRVLDHMQNLRLTEERFAALKDRIVRNLRNFPKQDAWQIARSYSDEVFNRLSYPPADRLAIAEGLALEDIRQFASELYGRVFIEALAHGNISAEQAVELTHRLQQQLGVQPVDHQSTFTQTYMAQPDPEVLVRVEQLAVNNSCFWREYYAGANSPHNRAIALILRGFLRGPYFTEMRSNQQLGYIVSAGPTTPRDNFLLYFIIQSATHAADDLEDRSDAFIDTYPQLLRDLPAENFAALKAAAEEEVKKKTKSIAEKAGKFNTLAFDFEADFERDRKTQVELEGITQQEVAAFLEQTLGVETRRMRTTLAFAKEHQAAREIENSFDDLAQWKESRIYR
ncbi:MAG TPA: hypothetical protein DIC52_05145 [Candidatus Latescibacteria bacterium]|nr:hypothetical protein [Candidatus Latescibacterota bacterium]